MNFLRKLGMQRLTQVCNLGAILADAPPRSRPIFDRRLANRPVEDGLCLVEVTAADATIGQHLELCMSDQTILLCALSDLRKGNPR
jgi:hypothetical protein